MPRDGHRRQYHSTSISFDNVTELFANLFHAELLLNAIEAAGAHFGPLYVTGGNHFFKSLLGAFDVVVVNLPAYTKLVKDLARMRL